MTNKVTPTQRLRVLTLLGEGRSRNVIASEEDS